MTYPMPKYTGQEPCAQIGPDLFFTKDDMRASYSHLDKVLRLCDSCQMQSECLEYALRVNVQGIWGGTTEGMRRQIRRSRNIVPEPNSLTA
jgi:WhiB family redox-sensing transcriptional regulator